MTLNLIRWILVGVWLLLHGLSVNVTTTLTLIFAIVILALVAIEMFGVQIPTRVDRPAA